MAQGQGQWKSSLGTLAISNESKTMAEQMRHLLPLGDYDMDDKERQTLREHIVWLGSQLEQERKQNQQTVVFLKRLLDPEDLGHAVSNEIRQLAYQLLIENHHIERNSWQSNK
jgi:hypothetical protein